MNEIATINNQLSKLIKPELVKISEHPKLRDFSIEESKAKTVDLVGFLLSLLGVSDDSKIDHHNALVIHIVENYTNYTFEQIYKAFSLFVKGEFKVKPFQQLNAVVFGQVMTEFDEYTKEKTRIYRLSIQEFKNKSKPLSEKEKDELMNEAIIKAIVQFKETGVIEIPISKYDWLDSKGKLQRDMTDEEWGAYKMTKYNSVKARLLVHYKGVRPQDKDHRNEIVNILRDLETSRSGAVISQSKLEILEDYFNEIITDTN